MASLHGGLSADLHHVDEKESGVCGVKEPMVLRTCGRFLSIGRFQVGLSTTTAFTDTDVNP